MRARKPYKKFIRRRHLSSQNIVFRQPIKQFAKKTQQTKDFFEGLKEVLPEGHAIKWANTIVNHYKEDTIGGSNYRIKSLRLIKN